LIRASTIDDAPDDDLTEDDVLRATLRVNTIIFAVVLGALTSIALAAISLLANYGEWRGGLVTGLLGVFLPGYARGWPGALFGMLWGFALGGCLGGLIYRLNSMHVLRDVDALVLAANDGEDFPQGQLRLHGPSLGLALGSAGALGLIVTTNLLVLRGTAAESVHARLLAEVLPGYAVTPLGSLIGALELFAILFAFCMAFVAIYNGVAQWRRRRSAATR
jgi:hypothetical protein